MAARDYEQEVRMDLTALVIAKIQIHTEAKGQADEIIRLVEKLSNYVLEGKKAIESLASSTKTIKCSIGFDASQLNAQVEALPLSELSECGLESLSNLLQSYVSSVSMDVLCGDGVTTTLADDSIKIIYALRLGVDFYDIFAALRADKTNTI